MRYIKTGSDVTCKRYLYASRGFVNARFVALGKTVPPIVFTDALNDISALMPDSILKKIYEIIEIKSQGKEKDKIPNIAELDEYIEDFLKEVFEENDGKNQPASNELDAELRRIVLNK
jgi:predicted nucleotidyltransferase